MAHGWSSAFVNSTTSNATFDFTPQMRVCPGNAGVCPEAFAALVSRGVQSAGSAAGAEEPVVEAAMVLLLLEVLVPGLAHAAARVHAASAAIGSRRSSRKLGIVVTAVVEVSGRSSRVTKQSPTAVQRRVRCRSAIRTHTARAPFPLHPPPTPHRF